MKDKLVLIIFFIILAISLVAIGITLFSLPKLGDERSNFIKLKAQSYSFTIMIGVVVLEIVRLIYKVYKTEETYQGMNPLVFLTTISFVYLITLITFKKRYGG